jgi:hypothetical protein
VTEKTIVLEQAVEISKYLSIRCGKTYTSVRGVVAVATHLSPCAGILNEEKSKEYDIAPKYRISSWLFMLKASVIHPRLERYFFLLLTKRKISSLLPLQDFW